MGDRVILMREGRIEQAGPPAEVYKRPVSPYAAHFFGVRNRLAVTRKGPALIGLPRSRSPGPGAVTPGD